MWGERDEDDGKERLFLKPKGIITEPEPLEEKPLDVEGVFRNTIIDLEKELDRLKRRIKKGEERFSEEDIDRLKYVQEELKAIQG